MDCGWLVDHLDDPQIRIIEVSSDPTGEAYKQGHIPGAVFWFWKAKLWHATDREFATPLDMSRHLGEIGVTPDSTVILYGDPVQYGTYALWVMMMTGHADVRLLDGSRTRWVAENRPLTTSIPAFSATKYLVRNPDCATRFGRDDIRAGLGESGRLLLDVRSEEEYKGARVSPPGDFDHGAERPGRIPGAIHLFFRDLLNEDDTFIASEQIRRKFSDVGVKSDSHDSIITYCRLSHRATLVWFALTQFLGVEKTGIYDGSWTEWGSIVGFPVERDI